MWSVIDYALDLEQLAGRSYSMLSQLYLPEQMDFFHHWSTGVWSPFLNKYFTPLGVYADRCHSIEIVIIALYKSKLFVSVCDESLSILLVRDWTEGKCAFKNTEATLETIKGRILGRKLHWIWLLSYFDLTPVLMWSHIDWIQPLSVKSFMLMSNNCLKLALI